MLARLLVLARIARLLVIARIALALDPKFEPNPILQPAAFRLPPAA